MNSLTIPGLEPLKINSLFCIGRNYLKHAKELNNEAPDEPMIFLKPGSSIIYNEDTIILPKQSDNVHHEVELVVAIGQTGKNINPSKALQYVAGYGIGIDITARDIQQKAKEKSHPWSVAKGFDTFAPISSFLGADQIGDPQNIELQITVNDEIRQQGNTRDMIFPVAELISYLSSIFTLNPGDLIFTGTPEGVSQIYDGDHIYASLNNGEISLNVSVTSEN